MDVRVSDLFAQIDNLHELAKRMRGEKLLNENCQEPLPKDGGPQPEVAKVLSAIERSLVKPNISDGYALVFTMLQYEGGKQRRALISTMTEEEMVEMLLPADQLTRFANAFTNTGRIAILYELAKGPRSSAELSAQTGLQGGQLYHHLRELIHTGMVVSEERNSYALSPIAGRSAFLGLNLLAKSFYHAAKEGAIGDELGDTD